MHGVNIKVINVCLDFLYDICLKYFLFEEELSEIYLLNGLLSYLRT